MYAIETLRRASLQFDMVEDAVPCDRRRLASPAHTLGVNPILVPMPGVRCKTCDAQGKETWVIPGKACHVCGTQCSLLKDEDEIAFGQEEDKFEEFI